MNKMTIALANLFVDDGMAVLAILLCLLCIAILMAWHQERTRLKHDVRTYRTCSEDQAKEIRRLNHIIQWHEAHWPVSNGSNVSQQQLDSMYFEEKQSPR